MFQGERGLKEEKMRRGEGGKKVIESSK